MLIPYLLLSAWIEMMKPCHDLFSCSILSAAFRIRIVVVSDSALYTENVRGNLVDGSPVFQGERLLLVILVNLAIMKILHI